MASFGVCMKVGKSIQNSIDEWLIRDYDSAMLHACNAVDGTAKKAISSNANRFRFTQLLRDNYVILGPMGIPGVNLVETRFPVKILGRPPSAGNPDVADIIYSIHRCSHAHGDELPDGFELYDDASGIPRYTRVRTH
jgi:hypothetical protein